VISTKLRLSPLGTSGAGVGTAWSTGRHSVVKENSSMDEILRGTGDTQHIGGIALQIFLLVLVPERCE
jgi:hypothetical protein